MKPVMMHAQYGVLMAHTHAADSVTRMCAAAHLHDKVPLVPESALQPPLELRILALELPIAPCKVPQLACNAAW